MMLPVVAVLGNEVQQLVSLGWGGAYALELLALVKALQVVWMKAFFQEVVLKMQGMKQLHRLPGEIDSTHRECRLQALHG